MSEAEVLTPGFVYPDRNATITPELQKSKHRCCDIDPALYGGYADPALLCIHVMLAMRDVMPLTGQVHMTQSFEQKERIKIGEKLIARGRTVSVVPAARGNIITSRFEFVRPDGSVPLFTDRSSMRPSAEATKKGPSETGKPKPEESLAGFEPLFRKHLEPAKVAEFSIEGENRIHDDPEAARRFGFKAPIAAGVMALNFIMEALTRAGGVPKTMNWQARFLRPMFWDEPLDILGRKENGRLVALRIHNPEGKPTSVATVQGVTY
ncbi:MAG: MaoC family dehydratase [Alphaproteobacteria bacterium]